MNNNIKQQYSFIYNDNKTKNKIVSDKSIPSLSNNNIMQTISAHTPNQLLNRSTVNNNSAPHCSSMSNNAQLPRQPFNTPPVTINPIYLCQPSRSQIVSPVNQLLAAPHKKAVKKLEFNTVIVNPIYASYSFGKGFKTFKIILPDLKYEKSKLNQEGEELR